jgi:hypothetical protein
LLQLAFSNTLVPTVADVELASTVHTGGSALGGIGAHIATGCGGEP